MQNRKRSRAELMQLIIVFVVLLSFLIALIGGIFMSNENARGILTITVAPLVSAIIAHYIPNRTRRTNDQEDK